MFMSEGKKFPSEVSRFQSERRLVQLGVKWVHQKGVWVSGGGELVALGGDWVGAGDERVSPVGACVWVGMWRLIHLASGLLLRTHTGEPVRNFVFEAYHVAKEHVCQARRNR